MKKPHYFVPSKDMLIAIGQLWAVVITTIVVYAVVLGATIAVILMSLAARNHIQSDIDPPSEGDTSSNDSRRNLKKTAEWASLIGGIAVLLGIVSILVAVGFFFGI